MKKITLGIYALLLVTVFQGLKAQPQNFSLATFATGFNEPLDITHAGDDRIFVVEKDGRIQILDQAGNKNAFPYLDIVARVRSSGSEQGLLGLAFHPDYQQNGYFYVNYTNNSGATVISRFTVMAGNPDFGDASSEQIMMTIQQPYTNHNGGCLKFGHDGYLYIGNGDGGSGGDPLNHGQNRTSMLGKILRIDVDNGTPYGIPADNPYVSDPNTLDEIWAIGVRNPWRFSFDRLNGDLWIGDVGQNDWEEIDYWPADATYAPNFGWRCREGLVSYNSSGCGPASNYDDPVYVFSNVSNNGCSITGGVRYRGPFHNNLDGLYFFTDYCSGKFWHIQGNPGSWTGTQFFQSNGFDFVGMGEDIYGQLYVAGIGSNKVFKVADSTCKPNAYVLAPDTLSVCDLGSVMLEGSWHPSLNITWIYNGSPIANADSGSIMATQAGQYQIILTNGSCSDTSDLVQLNFGTTPTGVTLSGLTPTYCSDDPATTMSGSPAGGVFSGTGVSGSDFAPAVAGTGSHLITYTYTNAAGCSAQDTMTVLVELCSGLSPATALREFTLFPNPVHDRFNVEFSIDADYEAIVEVVNVLGERVLRRKEYFESGFQRLTFDMNNVTTGLYFLKIRIGDMEFVKKFIVQP